MAKNKSNIYTCKHCNQAISNDRQSRSFHMEAEHPELYIRCDFCNFKSLHAWTTRRHVLKMHGPVVQQDAVKSFKCKLCDYVTLRFVDLTGHTKRMHGQESTINRICDLCDESFPTEQTLFKHLESVHMNPFVSCSICAHLSKNEDDMAAHERDSHKKSFKCSMCPFLADESADLNEHLLSVHKIYACYYCTNTFINSGLLASHLVDVHAKGEMLFTCKDCNLHFINARDSANHFINIHLTQQPGGVKLLGNSLDGLFTSYRFRSNENGDLHTFNASTRDELRKTLEAQLTSLLGLKFHLCVRLALHKPNEDTGGFLEARPTFRSDVKTLLAVDDIESALASSFIEHEDALTNFQERGSGFHLAYVVYLDLHLAKYDPLQVGDCNVKLPTWLKKKRAIFNVVAGENKQCFLDSILFHFKTLDVDDLVDINHTLSADDAQLLIKANNLDVSGIEYPFTFNQIGKFESKNLDIAIHVYGVDASRKTIYPLRISKRKQVANTIDLLLLEDKNNQQHFCLIKSLERILNAKGQHYYVYCRRCLGRFRSIKSRDLHSIDCDKLDVQSLRFPTAGVDDMLSFNSNEKKFFQPFVAYLDLESTMERCEAADEDGRLSKHSTNSYCYQIVTKDERLTYDPILYIGDDAIDNMLVSLKETCFHLRQRLDNPKKLNEKEFEDISSDSCHICGEAFADDEKRVRDHDHVVETSNGLGTSLGYAHNTCNLEANPKNTLLLVSHGAANYDSHFLIEKLANHAKDIKVIPSNFERYSVIYWTWICDFCKWDKNPMKGKKCTHYLGIKYLDSYKFLDKSLATLVTDFKEETDFVHLKHYISTEYVGESRDSGWLTEAVRLLKQKGVYCYDLVDDTAKLWSIEALPKREDFFNRLTQEHISIEEYSRAQSVWSHFNCKSLADYHSLYLSCDTMLLADTFEHYRKLAYEMDGLDVLNYVSAPSYFWDCMLQSLDVPIELIKDSEIHAFFEAGLRGGYCASVNRIARANNPGLSNYDPSKPESYIIYLDFNSLYGSCMAEKLPIGNYQWLSDKKLKKMERQIKDGDFEFLEKKKNTGYTLDVDLHYPESLHDYHSDFPAAPCKKIITNAMLSPKCLELKDKFGLPNTKCEKLIADFTDKEHYITYAETLKVYVDLGLKVTKLHRALSYRQTPWLKTYVKKNAKLRKKAKSKSARDYWKKRTNTIYGKCLEDVRKRIRLHLVKTRKKARKLISSVLYKRHCIYSKNLVGIAMKEKSILLNKPIAVGSVILERAKLKMYKAFYQRLKPLFGDKMRLMMTDTDSFLLHIEGSDVMEKLGTLGDILDTSDYAEDHAYFSTVSEGEKVRRMIWSALNAKVPGCLKDEFAKISILEVLSIRPKMYSVLTDDGAEHNKAKGVNTSAMTRVIHNDYLDCIVQEECKSGDIYNIRSFDHQVFTTKTRKRFLSPYDDKRFLLDDMITSLPYGSKRIKLSA